MAIKQSDLEKQILENNRVIIRVWTSEVNPRSQGKDVGHVSIETGGRYMSLWPKQPNDNDPSFAKDTEGKGVINSISHEFVVDYITEKNKYEKRPAEFTVCLYTLENDEIKEAFKSFKEGPLKLDGWCLFGGICANAESCVSMAWKLLEAGKIERLVSCLEQTIESSKESFFGSLVAKAGLFQSRAGDSSKGSIYSLENAIQLGIESPDALISIIKKAKLNELKKNILTREIYFADETYFEGYQKEDVNDNDFVILGS